MISLHHLSRARTPARSRCRAHARSGRRRSTSISCWEVVASSDSAAVPPGRTGSAPRRCALALMSAGVRPSCCRSATSASTRPSRRIAGRVSLPRAIQLPTAPGFTPQRRAYSDLVRSRALTPSLLTHPRDGLRQIKRARLLEIHRAPALLIHRSPRFQVIEVGDRISHCEVATLKHSPRHRWRPAEASLAIGKYTRLADQTAPAPAKCRALGARRPT
jgi:hypothetical protein